MKNAKPAKTRAPYLAPVVEAILPHYETRGTKRNKADGRAGDTLS